MEPLRNLGIVAHIDAGKTTLTERILHRTGVQPGVGTVDDGTAAMDWMPQEQERGISITAAATQVPWRDLRLQIVDTPGHVDFGAEVERCLRVLDAVIVVLDSVRGVESQTEVVWRQADRNGLPRLLFANKFDRPGADLALCVASVRERLDATPVPVVIPLFDAAGAFAGLGDVVSGRARWFRGEVPAELLPALKATVAAARENLIEACADLDERVLQLWLDGRPLPAELLHEVLRTGTLHNRVVPLFCGAALLGHGVELLLDGVCRYLPGPAERARVGPAADDPPPDPAAPFCGLLFKVQHLRGEVLHYLRVFAGVLRLGAPVVCARTGQPVAVRALWRMHVIEREPLLEAGPGELLALCGDGDLRTGDTLCDPALPRQLQPMAFAEPVVAARVEPLRDGDRAALLAVLRELEQDDPTLQVQHDAATGDIQVAGMGELHLEVVQSLLRARAGDRFRFGRPAVTRRQTVRGEGRGEVELRGAAGQSAVAAVRVGPGDSPLCRVTAAPDAGLSAPAAVEHARQFLQQGLRDGLAPHGLVVTVERAAVHGAGTGEAGPGLLAQAIELALGKAIEAGGRQELEPLAAVEVACPADSLSAVLADLQSRGTVLQQVSSGSLGALIAGRARLADLLGYATRLRSISRGMGRFSSRPIGQIAVGEDISRGSDAEKSTQRP